MRRCISAAICPNSSSSRAGKKYWMMAGMPGGLGFDIYPPGQKLTIYLQKIGFASGTPVAVLTMAKLPGGVTRPPCTQGRVHAQCAHGRGRAAPGGHLHRAARATFTYAGREYTLPLDLAGRHSMAPGMYSYENGVRTALLEYGSGDKQYLLLRVPVAEGAAARTSCPIWCSADASCRPSTSRPAA